AIALYAQQAVAVHVHILTDGGGYAPQAQRAAIRATRHAESRQALAGLGDGIDCEFGPYQDRGLLTKSGLIAHMVALLEQYQPQIVIAPSPWEIHPDHQACARAVAAAVMIWRRRAQADVGLMLYEIGSPLRANLLVDITSVWDAKEQAMQNFASQLQQQDYIRHVQGLNSYRTYTLPREVRYAEAYHYLAADDIAAMGNGEDLIPTARNLAAQYVDRWVESALQSASVHAEGLQQALLAQKEHGRQLEMQRDQRALQREQENLQYHRDIQWHQQEIQHYIQRHQQEVERLGGEGRLLQQEIERLQQHVLASEDALQQQRIDHEQQLLKTLQVIEALHSSHSWRMTAPLRALVRWFRR
ncbi:PIG-L family deacetylase, partial [Acidovorax sp. CCYZU-2555]|uniref:PIG-L family deacetylase n=1 Tax=Acidovorax sp. CCYZU-2555 TaxID=2835042 RepID=UPI001BD06BB6